MTPLKRRPGRPRRCPDAVLERVVRMRLADVPYRTMCQVLNAEKVLTPAGRPSWRPSTVFNLLNTRDALDLLDGGGSPPEAVPLPAVGEAGHAPSRVGRTGDQSDLSGPGDPRGYPESYQDVVDAADGRLDESHWVELKREIPAGNRVTNTELARDLASLAPSGGIYIVGVQDNNSTAGAVTGVNLAGLADRVDQIARSRIDPPLLVRPRELPDIFSAAQHLSRRRPTDDAHRTTAPTPSRNQ